MTDFDLSKGSFRTLKWGSRHKLSKWTFLLFTLTTLVVATTFLGKNSNRKQYSKFFDEIFEIADGVSISPLRDRWRDCSNGIYLDIGTNVAVQIRKLYDPLKFPGAMVLPIFDKYFGDDREKVCAVGFEPNSAHTQYLKTVNAYFEKHLLPAYVFTEVAVSSHRGNTTFFTDPQAPKQVHQWGASLAPWNAGNNRASVTVQLVDLHNFVLNVVVPIVKVERLKTGRAPPIIMKMDIEGAEFVVLPAMIVSGALCHLDLMFAEWHEDNMRLSMPERCNLTREEILSAFEGLRATNRACNVEFNDLDDESYVDGTAIPM
jgi:hypothetical protein